SFLTYRCSDDDGFFQNLYEAPALFFGKRTRLHDLDHVAHLGLVFLIVGLKLFRVAHALSVQRIPLVGFHGDDDGFVHLVAHDFSDPDFPLVPAAHPCRLLSIPSSRSRSTVFARAMSLRTWRIRA